MYILFRKFPFCWIVAIVFGRFLDYLGISGLSGKFLDCLESFQIVWKVPGLSGKYPDVLESFHSVLLVPGLSRKFPNCLESL